MDIKLTPEQIKKLETILDENDGVITAKAMSKMQEEFGVALTDELLKKWEDKYGTFDRRLKKLEENKNAIHSQEENGFKNIADFALSVKDNAKKSILDVDPRLKALTTDVHGEYVIPPQFAREILRVGLMNANLINRCTTIPLSGNSIDYPYMVDKTHTTGNLYGGVVMYWVDETGTITASDMKFGKLTLKLKKLAGLIPVSNEFMKDAPFAVNTMIRDVFGGALGWTLDNAIVKGNGAGKPLGLLYSPSKIEATKDTSQTAGTISVGNFLAMYAKMPSRFRQNAVWLYNPTLLSQILYFSIGNFPMFIPGGMRAGQVVDTILGRPAVECEHCEASGTVGDVYFTDLSQYLVATDATGGLDFSSSMHLYYATDQEAFRIIYRVDGQSWWETYITLANSETMSNIVTTAIRN